MLPGPGRDHPTFKQSFLYAMQGFRTALYTERNIKVMLAGFVFMAVGMFFHMRSAQCCGPRDAMLVGLGKRMRSIPIGVVQIMLWAVVLLTGWLLGGPV